MEKLQKICETDPLCCPKCCGTMKIIALVEQPEIIQQILKHVGLWEVKSRSTSKTHSPPGELQVDCTGSQVEFYDEYEYCDPDYSVDKNI